MLRGSTRRRKHDEDIDRLGSISPTYSAQRSVSAAKPIELGTGMLNSGSEITRLNVKLALGGQQRRRRAFTEIDDLLQDDIKDLDPLTSLNIRLRHSNSMHDFARQK